MVPIKTRKKCIEMKARVFYVTLYKDHDSWVYSRILFPLMQVPKMCCLYFV